MTLRGVLIGCGYASGHQLSAWASIPDVDIVAVSIRTRRHAERRAKEFKIGAVYDDLPTLLAETEPDFLDIATPPDSHVELVEIAAHYGVDILCQKPGANTLEELRYMIAVCETAGVALVVNENGRFQPWHRRIHQIVHNEERIGKPLRVSVEARGLLTMPEPNFGEQAFFATMPRLIMFELGVHHLDTMRYLVGEATTITAHMKRVSPHVVGEDEAVSVSNHNGVVATIDLSWARGSELAMGAAHTTWGSITLTGSDGSLALGYDGTLTVNGDVEPDQDWLGFDGVQLGYEAMQQHFVDTLGAGIEAETSGHQTLKTMELVFGAYHSADTGREYRVGTDIEELA